VLDRLIRYILKKIPTGTSLESLKSVGNHLEEYSTHDFLKLFVGEHESSPGLQVTFDRPVRTKELREDVSGNRRALSREYARRGAT